MYKKKYLHTVYYERVLDIKIGQLQTSIISRIITTVVIAMGQSVRTVHKKKIPGDR